MEENVEHQTVDKNDNKQNEDAELNAEDHPLLNNIVVLDTIIRYLKYQDIRAFRLVCHRWNEVSDNVFWKSSRIKVKTASPVHYSYLTDENNRLLGEFNKKSIQNFESTFPSPTILPSNAIKFVGYINRTLFDYFLKERGSLTLTNIYFKFFYEYCNTPIDLSHYLTTNVSTLDVIPSSNTDITISWEILANIQILRLENCKILLNGKIAPKELSLTGDNVVCYKEELFDVAKGRETQRKLLINDFVDFSQTKKLCLHGKIWKLDLSVGVADLERLHIDDVELMGFRNSQWTTNRLQFWPNICIGKKMKMNSISVMDNGQIDLQTLPPSLETLSICYCSQQLEGQIFVYPKLKSLCISTAIVSSMFPISNFTNCISLVDVSLRSSASIYKIDFGRLMLPNCIKRLKLYDVDITTDAPLQLDTLILSHYTLVSSISVLSHISTVKLILNLATGVKQDKDKMDILNFWKTTNSIKQFSVGPIDWSNITEFSNSNFSKCVNQMGKYYLFTDKLNGKGKSIEEDYFHKLLTFNP